MSEALNRYGADCFEWAAPGDRQRDIWMLRFDDAERGDMVFDAETYDDPEASAWEAWNRAAMSYNCRVFRTARLAPAILQVAQPPEVREAIARLVDPSAWSTHLISPTYPDRHGHRLVSLAKAGAILSLIATSGGT